MNVHHIPATFEYMEASVDRTIRWAKRGKKAHKNPEHKHCSELFKVENSQSYAVNTAEALVELDFPGYSIGGLSVGEPKDIMNKVLEFTAPIYQQINHAI